MQPDLILVGGGLANGLLAHRLCLCRPDLRLLVLERAPQIGGDHTWSFHERDLTPEQNRWLAPFIVHGWPHYQVMFPGLTRTLHLAYRSITGARFGDVLTQTLGARLRTGVEVTELGPSHVTLASGERLDCGAVIDGRGFQPSPRMVDRFQTFLGQELRLRAPHGLDGPVLMDATVAQEGAYRFIYLLPFSPDTLLIEDTYYTDRPGIDAGLLRGRIAAYAAARGWSIDSLIREEMGVLPVTLSGDIRGFWAGLPRGPAPAGLRAGLYHPTTGYSLPDAVRLADRIAQAPSHEPAALRALIHGYALTEWRRRRLFRLLNRLLFLAGPPERRYVIMRRFYGMAEPLISRFYAGALRPTDKLRLLIGRPPVAITRAVAAMLATGR